MIDINNYYYKTMASTIETLSHVLQKSPEKVTTILPEILDIVLKAKQSH